MKKKVKPINVWTLRCDLTAQEAKSFIYNKKQIKPMSKIGIYCRPPANEEAALTLNKEEEADNAHESDDEPRYNEGQAPVGGDPVAGDQRAQDVSH